MIAKNPPPFPYEIYLPNRDHYLHGLTAEPWLSTALLHLAASVVEAGGHSLGGESFYWAANA